MVSNRLSKVQKHIVKKKGVKAIGHLHENSRDTHRLQAAAARDDKINRHETLRAKLNRHYLLRIKAFQSYTTAHDRPLSIPSTQALIEDYLGRDDEELASLKSARRPGRPASNRETILLKQQDVEQKEYISGFWLPDLEDEANLRKLKIWEGKWGGLATLKFCRINRNGVKLESSFPPKGMS